MTDIRAAIRQLRRRPGANAIVVVTIGLGIAVTTAMLSLFNAILYKPAPAHEPSRLASIAAKYPRASRYSSVSYPDFADLRDRVSEFSGMTAYATTWIALGGANPERVRGDLVSGNFFDVLGVRAARGRTFAVDEDRVPGERPVVIISDALWRRAFAASETVVDSTVIVNGHAFTVIGVAPPGFTGVELADESPVAMWFTFAMADVVMPGFGAEIRTARNANSVWAIGRLRDGVRLERAAASVATVGVQISADAGRDASVSPNMTALPLRGGMDPRNRSMLAGIAPLLLLVPLLVLAVACANAANVLLARGLERAKELAVRRALGASRARLVRQLLTESALLAMIAGLVGVGLSYWVSGLVAALGSIPAGVAAGLTPDVRVLAVTMLVALASGLLFGVAPALSATRPALVPALKDDQATIWFGRQRHRLRDTFVVVQVALSLVMLVTGGLFVQGLSKALNADPGFSARNGLAVSYDLSFLSYSNDARVAFERRLLEAVGSLPDVEAVALASSLPFGNRWNANAIKAAEAPPDAAGSHSLISSITPDYFAALGVPLVRGRDFTAHDDSGSASVTIVNETLARNLWGDADPIGQRVHIGGYIMREVIGVARDGKYNDLTESAQQMLYVPQSQDRSLAMTLVVRSAGDPLSLAAPIREIVRDADPDLPLHGFQTLPSLIANGAETRQAAAAMLGVFGFIALFLASLGMYGVAAQAVSLRVREIGIRMSLGARAHDVVSLFVREGVRRSVVGVVIGLGISLAVSRLLSGFLFGVGAADIPTFAAGAFVLCTVAALACYVPARRASRVDPLVALRSE
jgi:putative ABC transport system permease protein